MRGVRTQTISAVQTEVDIQTDETRLTQSFNDSTTETAANLSTQVTVFGRPLGDA